MQRPSQKESASANFKFLSNVARFGMQPVPARPRAGCGGLQSSAKVAQDFSRRSFFLDVFGVEGRLSNK